MKLHGVTDPVHTVPMKLEGVSEPVEHEVQRGTPTETEIVKRRGMDD
jgi:hypothetical protein